jgi:hypothetical protein
VLRQVDTILSSCHGCQKPAPAPEPPTTAQNPRRIFYSCEGNARYEFETPAWLRRGISFDRPKKLLELFL